MAAKKKSVSVQIDVETIAKLHAAAESLSELAHSSVMGSDDPKLQKLAAKAAKKKAR